MELLAPWSLVGLAVVPAIFLWGLLAPRGRRVVVGSLVLWRRALGTGPSGRPSARLRLRDPLLWLDASAVLLVVLAVAQPAIHTQAPLEPVATLIIDRTASMGIAEDNASHGLRRHDAYVMARQLLEPFGDVPVRAVAVPGDSGTVEGEETTTQALFRRGDWGSVLAADDPWPVAVAEAGRSPDKPVVVATDVAPSPALPTNVYVLAAGGVAANAGLQRVAARIEPDRWWLLVAARADRGAPAASALVVSSEGKRLARRDGFLSPGSTAEAVLPMPGAPPKTLTVELVAPDLGTLADSYPYDNAACLAMEPADRVRVLLVGSAPASLRRALEARGDAAVVQAAADADVAAEGADCVVAYTSAVPPGWTGPAAVIGPPGPVGPVRPTQEQAPAEWRVAPGHPLAGVFYLEPPRVTGVPRWQTEAAANLLVGRPEAPLIVTWEAEGVRRLAVLFDLGDETTDWPRRAGFPVFWSRAVEWLVPREGRPAALRTHLPLEPMPELGGLAPGQVGFAPGPGVGVSFIGTAEPFQSGPGRDDSDAAAEAIRKSIETNRRATLFAVWPYLAAAALAALVLRAWVGR